MLSITPFERAVKKAGAGRISREAIEELREIITEEADLIAEQAARLTRHAKRKTVMKEDIEFIIKGKRSSGVHLPDLR